MESFQLSISALIVAGLLVAPAEALADNPIVQTIYTSDPAPMVYDGRVYVYTGHDEDTLVNGFFTMNEWRAYSSSDMVNWTDHGSPLRYDSFSWARGDAWAGQVIERNGRFYFYVPVNQTNGGMVIGVAVSDSPTGPFTDAIGRPLVSTSGCIDPTVFVDEDGQAYLYWGNPDLWYVRLNDDMISYQGSPTKVAMTTASFGTRSDATRPTTYEEGPWFYRRGGQYYLVFAGGPISEHIGYSTSTGPLGPWTYRGIIMPTEGSSFTNHAGVVDFKGRSYFFYHNGALPGGGGFHRSVAVEEFTYNPDGTFPTLHMTTGGPAAVGTLDPYVRTEAETIAWGAGVETEVSNAGGMNVSYIENGDTIKVREVDFGTGARSFEASVAAETSGGNIELRLGGPDGTLVGTCAVGGTGGWQTWQTVTCAVSGAEGIQDLYLRFTGGGGTLFNVDWWRFEPIDAGTGGAGTGGLGTGGATGGGATTGGATTGGATMTSGGSPASGGTLVAGTWSGGASSGGAGATVHSSGGSAGVGGAGASGTANPETVADEDGGCACRTSSGGSRWSAWVVLAAAALAAGRRRRWLA